MLASITSEALTGMLGRAVRVEADVATAAPAFTIVGLPDVAVQESRERVRAAIGNSGFEFPSRRVTVNLAPADLRKEGPSFDLPIALAFLMATGQVSSSSTDLAAFGELGLDGAIRPVAGALVLAESLKRRGVRGVIVSPANAAEASLVAGLEVYPVEDLRRAAGVLSSGTGERADVIDVQSLAARPNHDVDISEIRGQQQAKRALEIAAAGAHNLLMVGPPGSGKTMLARRLPGILPELSVDEAIEITRVHSVAGLLPADVPLICSRPFRAPHHTISTAGLVGGGSRPRPGEVSLAHLGVLFLDEFTEFRHAALEGLRQPLEDGQVTISRALSSVMYPARLTLVAAMNPCPCGFRGDRQGECQCPQHRLRQYVARLSGPLLDRIDMRITVPRVAPENRRTGVRSEGSEVVRLRVQAARERQKLRFAGTGVFANGHMSARQLQRECGLHPHAVGLLDRAYDKLRLSARACDRVVKVARTIADLGESSSVLTEHIAEALSFRVASDDAR